MVEKNLKASLHLPTEEKQTGQTVPSDQIAAFAAKFHDLRTFCA